MRKLSEYVPNITVVEIIRTTQVSDCRSVLLLLVDEKGGDFISVKLPAARNAKLRVCVYVDSADRRYMIMKRDRGVPVLELVCTVDAKRQNVVTPIDMWKAKIGDLAGLGPDSQASNSVLKEEAYRDGAACTALSILSRVLEII